MDNVHEICTKWLSEARAQNSVESCEFEAGRMLLFTRDEIFYSRFWRTAW